MDLSPITLEGQTVRLEPLTLDHVAPLREVACDDDLWRLTTTTAATPDDLRRYVETAIEEHAAGRSLPFAQVERATGRVVGSTRFGNIEQAHRRVEIGWTWIGRAWQRTAINTEAKYLLMRHAFERWWVNRVELKTDVLNERSRRAILRIGAKEEGTLRRHIVTWSGRVRDSVYFSVISEEWPEVRAHLEALLAKPRGGPPDIRS